MLSPSSVNAVNMVPCTSLQKLRGLLPGCASKMGEINSISLSLVPFSVCNCFAIYERSALRCVCVCARVEETVKG